MVQHVSTVAFEGLEVRTVDVQLQVAPAADVRARVARARLRQGTRFEAAGKPRLRTNAEAPAALLDDIATPVKEGLALLRESAERFALSARGYHRVLGVARTIADLDGTQAIGRPPIAEALSYGVLSKDLAGT
jgi:magnesium chelatase family protein